MMNTNGAANNVARALSMPLRTAPDMPSVWTEVDLDFDTAAQQIIEAHKRDGDVEDLPIADLKTWAIVPHEGQFALAPLTRHHAPKPLRAAAFSNLMTRISAPAEFIRRLPAPLQLATTNYLLATHNETSSATLRLRGEEVSAVVSDRYAPLDPEELLDCVRSALVRFDLLHDVRVRGVASGLVDNMRLVLPSESVAAKIGDVSHGALDITTSSFARSSVRISPSVFRLVCLNGMRAPEKRGELSFRHVGDTNRLRAGIAEAIPSALAHVRGLMTQWQRSVTFMVEDVQKQIEAMRELTIPEKTTLETTVRLETGTAELPERVSLYDFVNAMTASAKSGSPARRLEIETLAGDVLARHVRSS